MLSMTEAVLIQTLKFCILFWISRRPSNFDSEPRLAFAILFVPSACEIIKLVSASWLSLNIVEIRPAITTFCKSQSMALN